MADNVIGIVFGVAGGESIDTGSGKRIKDQLKAIIDKINGQKELNAEIDINQEHLLKQIGAIRTEIEKRLKNIKIGLEKLPASVVNNPAAGSGNGAPQAPSKQKQYQEEKAVLDDLIKKLREKQQLEMKSANLSRSAGGEGTLKQEVDAQAAEAAQRYVKALEAAKAKNADLTAILQKQALAELEIARAREKADEQLDSKERSYDKLAAKVGDWAVRNGQLISSNREVKAGLEDLTELARQPFAGDSIEEANAQYHRLNETFLKLQRTAHETGATTMTMGQKLKKALDTKLFNGLAILLLGLMTRAFRQMYQNVVKLDHEMTQLRIVTQKSAKASAEFADTVTASAKKIGSSIADLINATTVFARLGYSLRDAAELAEKTTIYSKVSALNIGETTANITAIIKAFDVSAKDLEGVVDQLIWVGNNFAISSAEIGIAMNNAASSLAANGNTLQQAIGIITAANTTLQNVNIASTAVRTIAARISNSKADLDSLGESADELGSSTAILRERLLALTNVDVYDMNGKLRSTYDILNEIALAWNEVEDAGNSAAVAALIAGTRQQNAFYSIMQNWQDAQSIVQNEADGYGALRKAQDEYINSIEGKLEQLKATWEGFSANLLDSGAIKGMMDAINGLVSALSAVVSVGNGIIPMIAIISVVAYGAFLAFTKLTGALVASASAKALDAAASNVLTASTYQHLLALGPVTAATLAQAVATGLLTKKQAAQILSSAALITKTQALGAAMKKFLTNPYMFIVLLVSTAVTAQSTFGKAAAAIASGIMLIVAAIVIGIKISQASINGFMASNPIGWILLLITAIVTLIMSIVKLFTKPSVGELKDAAKEAKEAFEGLKDQLDEVNERLEETAARIDELKKFAAGRQLSLVEQNELDKLIALNSELSALQKGLELETEIARVSAEKAAVAAADAILTRRDSKTDMDGKNAEIRDANGKRITFGLDANYKQAKIIIENWDRANAEQKAFASGMMNDLREQRQMIQYYADAATNDQKAANRMYERIYKEYDKFVIKTGGAGLGDIWDGLLVRDNFKSSTAALQNLANSATVTSDSLRELYDSNADVKKFINYLQELGTFSWNSAEQVDALVQSINDLYKSSMLSVASLTHIEILERMGESFDALGNMLGDIADLGVVSFGNLKDLLENYQGLQKYFTETSQGFQLKGIYKHMSALDILKEQVTGTLKGYTDKLEQAQKQMDKMEEARANGTERAGEYEAALVAVKNAEENLSKAMVDGAILLRSQVLKDETDRLNKHKDALNDQLKAYKSIIDIRKELLKTYKKELDYKKQLEQRQKAVADLQTELALARMDTSAAGRARVRELESKLQDATETLDDFTLEHAIEVLTDRLGKEYDEYQKLIEGEVEKITEAIKNLAQSIHIDMMSLKPPTEAESRDARTQIIQAVNTSGAYAWTGGSAGKPQYDESDLKKGMVLDAIDYFSRQLARSDLSPESREKFQKIKDDLIKLYSRAFPKYHTGGFVGDATALQSNEEFAKLLKGELVITPAQMNGFMKDTLPNLIGGGKSGATYNAPLVQIHCDSVTKDALPQLKQLIDEAVGRIKSEIDGGISRTGFKLPINRVLTR